MYGQYAAATATPLITGNDISGAEVAIDIQSTFEGSLSGTDNTITDVTTVMQFAGPSALSFTTNDFTGFVNPWTGTPPAGSLTCNWWGTGAGPAHADAATVASPWADGPIANGGPGVCN